jgi:hypothetical protein
MSDHHDGSFQQLLRIIADDWPAIALVEFNHGDNYHTTNHSHLIQHMCSACTEEMERTESVLLYGLE